MDIAELHARAKERYWKHKDLRSARVLLEKGIALARSQNDLEAEKPLQYDLASFCWPGWDELGITINSADIEAGERAAEENLRLARELRRELRGMGNAYFIVGAYHLVAKRYPQALNAFVHQEECAELAQDEAGRALAIGYAALADGLRFGKVDLGEILIRLRNSDWDDGPGFAEQLETAARVFGRT